MTREECIRALAKVMFDFRKKDKDLDWRYLTEKSKALYYPEAQAIYDSIQLDLPKRKSYCEGIMSDDDIEKKIALECQSIREGYNMCLKSLNKNIIRIEP